MRIPKLMIVSVILAFTLLGLCVFTATSLADFANNSMYTSSQSQIPAMRLTKTVGTVPGSCASTHELAVRPGVPVYYCFIVTNTGELSLTLNLLADPLFEELPPFSLPLEPSQTVSLTNLGSVTSTFAFTPTATTVNTATIYAVAGGGGTSISATATALVLVLDRMLYLPIVQTASSTSQHRAIWASQTITSYQVREDVSCFCPPEAKGIVTVQSNQIISVTDPTTDAPLDPSLWSLFRTIDELFNLIENAETRQADVLNVNYDPILGYPTEIYIDYYDFIIDDEIGYIISELAESK